MGHPLPAVKGGHCSQGPYGGSGGSHLGLTNTCSQKGLGDHYGGRSCLSILGISRCCRSSVSSGRLSPVSKLSMARRVPHQQGRRHPCWGQLRVRCQNIQEAGWRGREDSRGRCLEEEAISQLPGWFDWMWYFQAVGIPSSFALGCACPSLTPPLHPQKVVVGKGGSL